LPEWAPGSAFLTPGLSALAILAHHQEDPILPGCFGEDLEDVGTAGTFEGGFFDYTSVASFPFSTNLLAPLDTRWWSSSSRNDDFSARAFLPPLSQSPTVDDWASISLGVSGFDQRTPSDLLNSSVTASFIPIAPAQDLSLGAGSPIFLPGLGFPDITLSPAQHSNTRLCFESLVNGNHTTQSWTPPTRDLGFYPDSQHSSRSSPTPWLLSTPQPMHLAAVNPAPSSGSASTPDNSFECLAGGLYRCTVCGKAWDTREKLQRHDQRHGPKSKACPIPGCMEEFIKASELKRHMDCSLKHGAGKEFQCPKCPKAYVRKDNLLRHQRKCSRGR